MGREYARKLTGRNRLIAIIVLITLLVVIMIIGLLRSITINGETAPAYQHVLDGNTKGQSTIIMAPAENYDNSAYLTDNSSV